MGHHSGFSCHSANIIPCAVTVLEFSYREKGVRYQKG